MFVLGVSIFYVPRMGAFVVGLSVEGRRMMAVSVSPMLCARRHTLNKMGQDSDMIMKLLLCGLVPESRRAHLV